MLSYEILDGFVFAFVQFNCWIHVLILCFLGFAICALCHRSCLHAHVVGGHFSICFLYLFIFLFCNHCLLSFFCLSLDSLLAVFLFGPSSFFLCPFSFLSRESLFFNRLVYLALPDEVSIRLSQGYCLLSLEKISWLP